MKAGPRLAIYGAAIAAAPWVPPATSHTRQLATLREIGPAFHECWAPPDGLRVVDHVEVAVRFSLRADGSILGEPRIVFSTLPPHSRARELLAQAAFAALASCAPLPLSASLGGSVAGRIFTVRFIYNGPKGQGI